MPRILIVGGGSREHALGLGLAGADRTLFFAPGNAGTSSIGMNAAVKADDLDGLVSFAAEKQIDLVVVGPELPLTLGLADRLRAAGVRVFGPSAEAARLEGSKSFMKEICKRAEAPTAAFAVFTDAEKAKQHARSVNRPLVVKADGLCAGKGVVVAGSVAETCAAIDMMLGDRALGDAGSTIVLEELLPGEEASFHVVCDGTRAVPLVAAQDHKRVFDGDKGPNTGGMGAYAPAPVVTPEVQAKVMSTIVEPVLRVMNENGTPFQGVLFVGLMIEDGTPRVLEFNVRFGDPETTVLVPMLDGDWLALLDGAARGDLSSFTPRTKPGAALAVVMAAEKYPAAPITGDPIAGVGSVQNATVCHAGTKLVHGDLVTAGGRVLTVVGQGASLAEARERAYAAVETITWRGEHHRRDIGHRALG